MKIEQTLSKAFQVTKKYPFLWLLSFLTILGGVAYESQMQFSGNISSEVLSKIPTTTIQNFSEIIGENISTYLPTIIIVALVLILISITLFIVGLIAKSGQIDSIIKLDKNEKTNFGMAFSNGKNYAWRIFLLRLLTSIAIIASILVSIPILLITFLFFFITIPLLWIYYTALNIISKNAEILIIKNNYGVFDSIKKSWKLLLEKWKNILVLWLVNFGLNLATTFVTFFAIATIIIFAIIIVVAIGLLIFYSQITALIPVGILILIFLILILVIISLFINSILHTFFTSYWTIGINGLTKK